MLLELKLHTIPALQSNSAMNRLLGWLRGSHHQIAKKSRQTSVHSLFGLLVLSAYPQHFQLLRPSSLVFYPH